MSPCQVVLVLINWNWAVSTSDPSLWILTFYYLWPSSTLHEFVLFLHIDRKRWQKCVQASSISPTPPSSLLLKLIIPTVLNVFIIIIIVIIINIIIPLIIIAVNEKLLARFCSLLLRRSEKLLNLLGSRCNLTFASYLWRDGLEMFGNVRNITRAMRFRERRKSTRILSG